MIRMNEEIVGSKIADRILTFIITLSLLITGMLGHLTYDAEAAASTVTVRYGTTITYGSGWTGFTSVKWVTHIDGEAVDTDEIPGVSRSYAYCVQPTVFAPPEGTYVVTLIDDDDSGKIAKMRKLIYYLPGSYGYSKVTKSKWFSDYSTNEAYVVGHLALSWIYEGYSDSSDVWGGAPSSTVSKAKKIVDDLKKLPDPPDSYEVFWVRVSGKQDIFGAFYAAEYGEAKVQKVSSIRQISDGNSCYTLEGAEYTLYEDAALSVVAETSSGKPAVLKVKADGSSDPIEVLTGDYYVKETKAPRGYALSNTVHSIEVMKDKTTTFTAQDVPKSNQVGLILQKLDKETGLPVPQGMASLEGAEYTVSYYDITPRAGMSEAEMAAAIGSGAPAKISGRDAVWVFRTDAEGKVDMSLPDKYMINERSANLYYNSAGKAAFPIGIVCIEETAAPEGYLLDTTKRYAAICEEGSVENLTTYKAFTDDRGLREQVKRGDISLSKAAEGRKRMQGVEFLFTSLTTGEQHVLVTDRNGYLCSSASWNLHSKATNLGETADDGIWFNGYNDEETGAKVDDRLGALPYDKYLMTELRSEANAGYELITDKITITRDSVTLDLGTYDDEKEPVPELATQAQDAVTKTHVAEATTDIEVIDSVNYKNVVAGNTYTVEGIMMDKATGEPLKDDEGNEIRGASEFYAASDSGTVEVSFMFSGESLGGKKGVIFEYLKLEGVQVAEHADINSEAQTVGIEDPPPPPPPPTPEKTPETGDGMNMNLLYYLFTIAACAEGLLLTKKRRNDRLN